MMNKVKMLAILVFLCQGLLGCAPAQKNYYYWGKYEQLIHDMYVKPGTADAGTQIQKLTTDIQKAQNYGKEVPPGVYAHLGFMYALKGNIAQAEDAFNEEKARYPESVVFIDGMMNRAKEKRAVTNE
ncbi:MAG: DUF4810 domain-containing protein [Pseudomonadales bacterium]|nr:DUF4810 domain-containing protein [Pseudomonadales bacterium]